MADIRIIQWNGNDLPSELRDLPTGRYQVTPSEIRTPEEEELVEWMSWNGVDIPPALREMAAGEYHFVRLLDLSPDEEAKVEAGLDEIAHGQVVPSDEVDAMYSQCAATEQAEHLNHIDERNPRLRLRLADELEEFLCQLIVNMVIEPPEIALPSGRTVQLWQIRPLAVFYRRERATLHVVRVLWIDR